MTTPTPEVGEGTNPLLDPFGVPMPTGSMDPAKTTHEDAEEQDYHFGANTRSQNTPDLNKAPS